MNGDGMGVLAALILGAMVLIIGIAAAIGAWIARALARRRMGQAAVGARLRNATIAGAAIGIGAGVLITAATFFEGSWSPPDEITLVLPPGFAYPVVYLLEDRAAAAAMPWQGGGALPFTRRRARLDVPSSGVVRVREYGFKDGVIAFPEVHKVPGGRVTGGGSMPAPKGLGPGIGVLLHFDLRDSPASPDPDSSDEAGVVRAIRSREGR